MQVENESVVDRPFDVVWDDLVRELAGTFYVINNIDKQSRLINVSYSSDTPALYVDAGRTRRVFERSGEKEIFEYAVAESSVYEYGITHGAYGNLSGDIVVTRKTALDGRANIYIAPAGEGTRVTVNCRYALGITVTAVRVLRNAFGGVDLTEPMPTLTSTSTYSCTTSSPTKINIGSAQEPTSVVMQSTGNFERDILALVH